MLFSWPGPAGFESLASPFPEPKGGGCTAFSSGCKGKSRQKLHTAGEAEAAEPSAHNGAPREGEGRRLQQGWEPRSRNGGSEGGTKERKDGKNAGSHQC